MLFSFISSIEYITYFEVPHTLTYNFESIVSNCVKLLLCCQKDCPTIPHNRIIPNYFLRYLLFFPLAPVNITPLYLEMHAYISIVDRERLISYLLNIVSSCCQNVVRHLHNFIRVLS